VREDSKYLWIGVLFVIFLIVFALSASFIINAFSSQTLNFYVPRVNGAPDFSQPGKEAFWEQVPVTRVDLVPSSNYPPSGLTDHVDIQMAWTNLTGTPELIVKMVFPNYGGGPSYSWSVPVPVVNNTAYPGGQLQPIYTDASCIYTYQSCYGGQYPQDVGFMPLASGPGYTYPEQAIVILGIAPGASNNGWYTVSYKPKLSQGTTGALDTGGGGAAELWVWSSNPTDNSTLDTGYPGLSYPGGAPLNTSDFGLPPQASYAIDGYSNSTSFYQIGGLPGSSQYPFLNLPFYYTDNYTSLAGITKTMNPFMVQAKGLYDPRSNSWTVEFVRALNTTTLSSFGEDRYQLQMNSSSPDLYYIAFAVTQGMGSQTYLLYYNSVSFWWSFEFQKLSPIAGYNPQYGRATGSGPSP
jgi:hypothetical protein